MTTPPRSPPWSAASRHLRHGAGAAAHHQRQGAGQADGVQVRHAAEHAGHRPAQERAGPEGQAGRLVRDNLQNGKLNAVYKEFHGVNLPPEVQGPAAERPEATMARIASVDIFRSTCCPRSCAPTRCRASSGRKRPSCASPTAMARSGWATATPSAPAARPWRACWTSTGADAAGPRGRRCGGLWRELMYRVHATTVGALTSIALAAIDTALWDLRARRAGLPLHRLAGGGPHPALHHRGRLAAPADRGAGRGRGAGPGGRLSWRQAQGRAAPCGRGRGAHRRRARGRGRRLGHHGGRQPGLFGARGDPPRARLRASGHCRLEEPIHADDVHAHRRLSASTTVPIAVGESLYSLSQFRTICRATPARWCRWTWVASAASRRG